MSLITNIIPSQGFEIIRDRIAFILADELTNQYALSDNESLNAPVYIDRFVPFDKEELPAVNVAFTSGNQEDKSVKQAGRIYRYNIDCFSSAKSSDADRGDTLAMNKLQRLIGVCGCILDDAKYKKLGFDSSPFIMNKNIESIQVADPDRSDALSVVFGRIILAIKAPETFELIDADLIGGMDSRIKLESTDKGYRYTLNT